MIIGIDVGGTHADGVLLQGDTILSKNKVKVDHDNLGDSIISLLRSLLPKNKDDLKRIHLSTTLCTNALISEKLDKVGMFIQAGPGMNPEFFQCGENVYFLSGAVDHRGKVIRQPLAEEIERGVNELKKDGIISVGIVTKFSHRNNEHELLVQDHLNNSFSHISLGHRISGMPNFPRRVYTTWLNSALKSTFFQFKDAMETGFRELGINCPCYILKADGGTIPFENGCEFPCQSIHSGPSASVMGAMALVENMGDAIMLDIGGTTTDIAILADGVPLLEPYGATVEGRPTLIRALLTKSVGLGGDSLVSRTEKGFQIGPRRLGPPMAFGGNAPTPTDAMIVLGKIEDGSLENARAAMKLLQPEKKEEETASELLHLFAEKVYKVVQKLIEKVFERPVYTVTDFLQREKITPGRIITIGGPAQALQEFLQDVFSLECVVPQNFEVANAIGSARARLTVQTSLYADTNMRQLSIPEISCIENINKMFDMIQAEIRLKGVVADLAKAMGDESIPDIDFIERVEMNTVRGFATTGKIMSLKAQIRPGLAQVEGK